MLFITRLSASLLFGLAVTSSNAFAENAEAEALARSLAALLERPVTEMAPLAKEYFSCATKEPRSLIASHGVLAIQAAGMAATEPLPSSRALFTDFTRQVIVATSAGTSCVALANHWNRLDPFVRLSVDIGLGLAQSDIDAAIALRRLSDDGARDPAALEAELLALWDGYTSEDEEMARVFLTRLNVWTPLVKEKWDGLSAIGRKDATHLSEDGTLPDGDQLVHLIGDGWVAEWVGGSSFVYTMRDMSTYEDVIQLAKAGFFGGRSYEALVARYRAIVAGASSMMLSNQQFGVIGDLMDMNTGYLE